MGTSAGLTYTKVKNKTPPPPLLSFGVILPTYPLLPLSR